MAEKLGGLPLYGWAGIGAIGVAGYMYEKKKKAAAAAAAATQAAGTTNPAGLTPITTIPYAANISYGNGSAGGARHGATGAVGAVGPAGPAGPAGSVGATGPAGAVGATGPAAPAGTTAPVVTPPSAAPVAASAPGIYQVSYTEPGGGQFYDTYPTQAQAQAAAASYTSQGFTNVSTGYSASGVTNGTSMGITPVT